MYKNKKYMLKQFSFFKPFQELKVESILKIPYPNFEILYVI